DAAGKPARGHDVRRPAPRHASAPAGPPRPARPPQGAAPRAGGGAGRRDVARQRPDAGERDRAPARPDGGRLGLPRPARLAQAVHPGDAPARRRRSRGARPTRAGAAGRRRALARRSGDRSRGAGRHAQPVPARPVRCGRGRRAKRRRARARRARRPALRALDGGRLAASVRDVPRHGAAMTFGHPLLLLLLLVVPLLVLGWLWLERRRRAESAAFSSPALVPNLIAERPGRRRTLPLALFLAATTLLVVGAARPHAKV